jgi:NADH-quinone oxidoreductase subunit H
MIGEYLNIVLMCAMMVILFMGGWHGIVPMGADFLNQFPEWIVNLGHLAWFMFKIVICFFLFALVKAVVPRYRYDQLMRLGWKIFLPTALVAVILVGGYVVYSGVQA